MPDNKMSNAYEELAKYWWNEFGNEELDEIQIQSLVKQSCTFQDVSVTRGAAIINKPFGIINKQFDSDKVVSIKASNITLDLTTILDLLASATTLKWNDKKAVIAFFLKTLSKAVGMAEKELSEDCVKVLFEIYRRTHNSVGPTNEILSASCKMSQAKLDEVLSSLEKLKSIELRNGQWFVTESIWMKI